MTYARNLVRPETMVGFPHNSTTGMNGTKGVTVTAQAGMQECFADFTFSGLRNTPLVFRVDVGVVSGDLSTLRNGMIVIAQRNPWVTLGYSSVTSGTAIVKFTPTSSFLIRLYCPDEGKAVYDRFLLMSETDWEQTVKALDGSDFFDEDTRPLILGGA
ncbi:hypothetical protein KIH79_07620 [Bifidobacterium sp. 82T10]|uniref:Uncharacterized protein n=1 Tax=Bifidobacterium miconis TaxID=2834435 RepID=A0ABS6WFG7_9BIFI|nr:hypothetical protein [Bifidobacterium miconis]MBW3092798.1 hypothetical protein [Bifidobacterium miconis]